MLALSRAIWVVVALSATSVASCAWSLARVACAWASVALRVVGSTVARTWPTLTTWFGATSTAVTLPDTAKFRSAVVVGSMVPVAATVCWMVPSRPSGCWWW